MNQRTRMGQGLLVLVSLFGVGVVLVSTTTDMAALPPAKRAAKPNIDVLFSPDDGCQRRIVREIGEAERSIQVQMYIFTSSRIADALVEARERGVECTVILDKRQAGERYSKAGALRKGGVKVCLDDEHSVANNKIILIDGHTVITGSYNFTRAAEEKNAENLLIIKHYDDVNSRYRRNFEDHLEHSRPDR